MLILGETGTRHMETLCYILNFSLNLYYSKIKSLQSMEGSLQDAVNKILHDPQKRDN